MPQTARPWSAALAAEQDALYACWRFIDRVWVLVRVLELNVTPSHAAHSSAPRPRHDTPSNVRVGVEPPLTTCVSVILLIRLPGVGGVLTMGSGDMSGDRPLGSIMDRVRLDVPNGEATPPLPPKFVLTAAGAAGFAAAGGGGAAADGAGAGAALLLLLPLLVVVLLVEAAGASATAAEAAGRDDVEGSSLGSPNSVSNLSRMSILLPSICSLSLSTRRFTCTAPSLKGSVRPANHNLTTIRSCLG